VCFFSNAPKTPQSVQILTRNVRILTLSVAPTSFLPSCVEWVEVQVTDVCQTCIANAAR